MNETFFKAIATEYFHDVSMSKYIQMCVDDYTGKNSDDDIMYSITASLLNIYLVIYEHDGARNFGDRNDTKIHLYKKDGQYTALPG